MRKWVSAWGSGVPIVAAAEKPPRGCPKTRVSGCVELQSPPRQGHTHTGATAPATALEREDIDLAGEPRMKKDDSPKKAFEGSSYGCAALRGAHGLFGGCPF
eukprot:354469-Chlamydomonas_euryale.AAC.5